MTSAVIIAVGAGSVLAGILMLKVLKDAGARPEKASIYPSWTIMDSREFVELDGYGWED